MDGLGMGMDQEWAGGRTVGVARVWLWGPGLG